MRELCQDPAGTPESAGFLGLEHASGDFQRRSRLARGVRLLDEQPLHVRRGRYGDQEPLPLSTQRGTVRISSRPEAPPVIVSSRAVPLFVCYANCCRSVLASFLYRRFCAGDAARSAGLEPGERTSDRALAMLRCWGIDAAGHVPTKLNRLLCDEAGAIFVMAPPYLRRLLLEYGEDLASKAYLFTDPFTRPSSLKPGAYTVSDPSFDERPAVELAKEFAWMRERVLQIRRALLGRDRPLIAAATYLDVLESVDPMGH